MIKHEDITDRMIHGAPNRAVKAGVRPERGEGRENGKGGGKGFAKAREGQSRNGDDQEKRINPDKGGDK